MHFLGALKSLTSPEKVAELFVRELIKSSNVEGSDIGLQFAANFASDCLLGIGLDCTITVEQIEQSESYKWPKEQLKTYRFEYQQKKFDRFSKCLTLICKNFELEHQLFSTEGRDSGAIRDDSKDNLIESPLYCLIEVMAIWCNVFRKLLEENHEHEKWLNEPLARINFPLFLSCHELGTKFNWEEPELLSICKLLYKSALKGLRYRETHLFILEGLLKLCERDFLIIYECNSKCNLFYEAFAVDYKDISHLKVYKTLTIVLTNNNKSVNTTNKIMVTKILNELLLQPRMLKVYYNTLINKKKNPLNTQILEGTLKFLKLLQRQMLDVSKFQVGFMEAILELCTQYKGTLGDVAAELYITIMRRMTTDPVILKHILLCYSKDVSTPLRQSIFIRSIYKHFSYIHTYKNIYEIIIDYQNDNEVIRFAAAQFLLTIICMGTKSQEISSMDEEIHNFLKILPDGLRHLNCQNSTVILLQILRVLPINQWHIDLIQNFVDYASGVLTTFDNNFQYPLLMNVTCLLMDCLQYTKQWEHIGDIADKIMREFLEEHRRRKESNNFAYPYDALHYYNVLKRLNIVLKVAYDLYDNINDVLSIIIEEFLHVPKNGKIHTFMDLYAFEIMCSCILKLSQNELDFYRSMALEQGKRLAKFVWLFLKDIQKLLLLPVMHIKTYFNIMVMLLCCLPINMEVSIYQTLNEILIQLNFKKHPINEKDGDEPMQLKRDQSLLYQQLMLQNFVHLHQTEHIKINTNVVWKLCIYYKLSQHQFNNELRELLVALAKNHLNIYKHILPVLIYNLYKISPNLRLNLIKYIMSEHKKVIFEKDLIQDKEIMCCHVALTLLQLIQKSMELRELCQKRQQKQLNQNNQTGKNRLKALAHLDMWMEAAYFKDTLRKSIILQQLQQLQNYNLNADECKLYERFQAKLEGL